MTNSNKKEEEKEKKKSKKSEENGDLKGEVERLKNEVEELKKKFEEKDKKKEEKKGPREIQFGRNSGRKTFSKKAEEEAYDVKLRRKQNVEAFKEDESATIIYVKDVPFSKCKPSLLQDLFSKCGKVKEVRIPLNEWNQARGQAFVEFESHSCAVSALDQMHGVEYFGRYIKVEGASRRKENPVQENPLKQLSNEVKVRKLKETVEEGTLEKLFGECGKVIEVRIVRDDKRVSKKYAFVKFEQESSVEKALELEGTELEGNKIKVSRANKKTHK